jgi:hypothetical protein
LHAVVSFGKLAEYVYEGVGRNDGLSGIVGVRLRVLVEDVMEFLLYVGDRLPVSAIVSL